MRPTVLIAESRGFSSGGLAQLREHAEVRLADVGRGELIDELAGVDILWVRLRNQIDAEVMDAAPDLKVIASATTGLDHIDLEGAARRGITVLSLKGDYDFLSEVKATAEYTVGLMLALLRRIPAAHAHSTSGGWDRDGFRGRELHDSTVGIIGYGRVGRLVAGYLRCFGANLLATDVVERPREDDGTPKLVPLSELMALSDIVTIHVDLSDKTRGLLGGEELGGMKAGAWIVNTSRGELVDEAALVELLEKGHLAGAALDVLSDERISRGADDPLLLYARTHDNLLITPHVSGCTLESMDKTEMRLATKLIELVAGVDEQVAETGKLR